MFTNIGTVLDGQRLLEILQLTPNCTPSEVCCALTKLKEENENWQELLDSCCIPMSELIHPSDDKDKERQVLIGRADSGRTRLLSDILTARDEIPMLQVFEEDPLEDLIKSLAVPTALEYVPNAPEHTEAELRKLIKRERNPMQKKLYQQELSTMNSWSSKHKGTKKKRRR